MESICNVDTTPKCGTWKRFDRPIDSEQDGFTEQSWIGCCIRMMTSLKTKEELYQPTPAISTHAKTGLKYH